MPGARLLARGQVERIGDKQAKLTHSRFDAGASPQTDIQRLHISDHRAGLYEVTAFLGKDVKLSAIGHRVVHGGDRFRMPTLINDQVLNIIRGVSELAPLHNDASLLGIEVCQELFPDIPQVAVFDTAFHKTMPAHAYRYALPTSVYEEYAVRRYGFHGTSHAYVVKQAAAHLQRPLESLNIISLHLGNGASATAIQGGQCIDTSMGMTPLEGLMMGTRCGDIDPAIALFLQRVSGKSSQDIESLLNNESGLKGVCGETDMREVLRLADTGDAAAQLAVDMYCYRIRKYIGAYYAALGHVDAIVFTAGVGENAPRIRQQSCSGLDSLGISIDVDRNTQLPDEVYEIQSSKSDIKVLVVHSNEALEIARQTAECIES
jgi:acetate kinase